VPTHGFLWPPLFGMKYAPRTGWVGSRKSEVTPLWKPRSRSNASRGKWRIGWKIWRTNTGAILRNPCTETTSRYGKWQWEWCEFPLHPLHAPGALAPSDSERAEVLTHNMKAHCHRVNVPFHPAVTEMVNEGMRADAYAPVSETKLSSFRRSYCRQGTQVRQCSVPKSYSKHGTKTSNKARDNLSHECVQRCFP
jgi:hypothetical protein